MDSCQSRRESAPGAAGAPGQGRFHALPRRARPFHWPIRSLCSRQTLPVAAAASGFPAVAGERRRTGRALTAQPRAKCSSPVRTPRCRMRLLQRTPLPASGVTMALSGRRAIPNDAGSTAGTLRHWIRREHAPSRRQCSKRSSRPKAPCRKAVPTSKLGPARLPRPVSSASAGPAQRQARRRRPPPAGGGAVDGRSTAAAPMAPPAHDGHRARQVPRWGAQRRDVHRLDCRQDAPTPGWNYEHDRRRRRRA